MSPSTKPPTVPPDPRGMKVARALGTAGRLEGAAAVHFGVTVMIMGLVPLVFWASGLRLRGV